MIGFFRRKPKPAQRHMLPPGLRVYAVGDVHGRADLLDRMIAEIERDHAARGPAELLIIFLGDLVDRGPASAEAVATVRRLAERLPVRLLKGNHEDIFVRACEGDRAAARALMSIGGDATVRSYGIGDDEAAAGSFADFAVLLENRVPREDVRFLDAGEDMIRLGDYVFVHAGIKPGVPLDRQDADELRWVRDSFTGSSRDHGVMVVHGHSISDEVEDLSNRIGLDTGAFATGRLSAIGIESGERWFLEARGAVDPRWCAPPRT